MHVIRATFDGEKVIIPGEVRGLPPGEVIIVFDNTSEGREERQAWSHVQEAAFAKAWNNDEDAIYDSL